MRERLQHARSMLQAPSFMSELAAEIVNGSIAHLRTSWTRPNAGIALRVELQSSDCVDSLPSVTHNETLSRVSE